MLILYIKILKKLIKIFNFNKNIDIFWRKNQNNKIKIGFRSDNITIIFKIIHFFIINYL